METSHSEKQITGRRKKPNILIIATSLNAQSKSLILARKTHERLLGRKVQSTLISLRDYPLPFCDGTLEISHDRNALALRELVQQATHVVFGLPIYNVYVNAAAKNLIELLFNWGCWKQDEWDDYVMGKTAGFLCVGGADHSRLAVLSFANTLMVECWWWIAPRYVYAVEEDFKDGALKNERTLVRIDRLIDDLLKGPQSIYEEVA
jgi:NAD(P)H-dependent FMN reductase